MSLIKGDVAIVTGASRGLDLFIAEAFAHLGVRLMLAARTQHALNSTAEKIRAYGVEVLPLTTDVSSTDDLKSLVETAMDCFGRIDVLVNNAVMEYAIPYDQTEIEDIQRMVEVNLAAPMVLTRLVLPEMLKGKRGHINHHENVYSKERSRIYHACIGSV